MKLSLFIVLLVAVVVSFVQGATDPCSLPFTLTFQTPLVIGCNMDPYLVVTENGNSVIDVDVTGPGPVGKVLSLSQFRFSIEEGGIYTANYTYLAGSPPTTVCHKNLTFPVVKPKVNVVHPTCPYGAAQVEITESQLFTSITNLLTGETVTTMPITVHTSNGGFRVEDMFNDDCLMLYVTQPATSSIPQYQITPQSIAHPGSVKVLNHQDYTLLMLNSSWGDVFPFNATSGAFENIKSTQPNTLYYMTVESAQCGTQVIPLVVRWEYPKQTIKVTPYQCNSTHAEATVEVEGATGLEILYNGETVPSSPFPVQTDTSIQIGWSDSVSGLSQSPSLYQVNVFKSNTPTFKVINPLATPTQLTVLQFDYNGNFSDLSFSLQSSSPIVDQVAKTVTLPFVYSPNTLSISSACSGTETLYQYNSAQPIFHTESATCLDPMDVYVVNYQLFEQPMTLISNDAGDPVQLISENGVFFNVPPYRSWKSTFIYNGTEFDFTVYPTFEPAIDISSNLTVQLTNVSGIDCDSGHATATIYYGSRVVSVQELDYEWTKTLSINAGNRCVFTVEFPAPLPDITYTISHQPVCQESFATIQLNYTSQINYISVNGNLVSNPNNTVIVVPGNYTIQAGKNSQCYKEFNITVQPTDPSFSIASKYISITPQSISDCNTPNGQIILKYATDTQVFPWYTLDNSSQEDVNGVWTVSTASGPFALQFEHSYCGSGRVDSIICPTEDIDLGLVIKPSHCSTQQLMGDGQIQFNPVGISSFIVTSSYGYWHQPTNTLTDLGYNAFEITVSSGTQCLWKPIINVGNATDINFQNVLTPINGSIGSLTTIQGLPSDTFHTSFNLQNYKSLWPSEADGVGYVSMGTGELMGYVIVNNMCPLAYDISYDTTIGRPAPNITVFPTCNFENVTVQVPLNLLDYYFVVTSNGFSPDETGIITNIVANQVNTFSFYDKVTGQFVKDVFVGDRLNLKPVDYTYEFKNATCENSIDVQLIIHSNDPTLSFYLIDGDGYYLHSYDQPSNTFSDLIPNSLYALIVVSTDGCYFSNSIRTPKYEPKPSSPIIQVKASNICNSKDTTSTVTITNPLVGSSSFFYSVNGVKYNGSTTTLKLPAGEYSGNVNVTKDVCMWTNQTFQFQVTKNLITAAGTQDKCEVSVAVTGGSSSNYNIALYDKNNQLISGVLGQSTHVFKSLETNEYSIIVTDEDGCVSDTFPVTVSECDDGTVSSGIRLFSHPIYKIFILLFVFII